MALCSGNECRFRDNWFVTEGETQLPRPAHALGGFTPLPGPRSYLKD